MDLIRTEIKNIPHAVVIFDSQDNIILSIVLDFIISSPAARHERHGEKEKNCRK